MIRPIPAFIVAPDWCARVVSPAYDALTSRQRRDFMVEHPDSYLHVTRSLEDDQRGERTPAEIAESNAEHLRDLLRRGAFVEHPPAIYLYRMTTGNHVQTAIVADIPLTALDDGVIRPHEGTRTDREDQLVLHLRTVGATSSPVAMAYRDDPDLAVVIDDVVASAPMLDFAGAGGLHQQVWCLDDAVAERLIETFGTERPLYVTDGHHRLAAAIRYRDEIEYGSAGSADSSHHYVMCALFAASELRTLAFHRMVVSDMTADELAIAVADVATLTAASAPDLLAIEPGGIGVYLRGEWFALEPHAHAGDKADVTWLQDEVLGPVLGIVSPRTDRRLDHITAAAGVDALTGLCDERCAIGFLLHPTPVDALIVATDAGEMMPPKSTFFSPKPRSGVFLRFRR
ncbi:MAG: DUF1015 family protein [Acidimicrobiia bacterium]|nr:DUF1015 family protein [Acidimicrobiia bacterium]